MWYDWRVFAERLSPAPYIISTRAGRFLVAFLLAVTLTSCGGFSGGDPPGLTPSVNPDGTGAPAVGPYYSTPPGGLATLPPLTAESTAETTVPVPTWQATPTVEHSTPAPTATPIIPQPLEGAAYSDRLGINFISSAQHNGGTRRFYTGIAAGAGWDRFAIYWHEVEPQPDEYSWAAYDEVVRNDVIYGLRIDAILLGAPERYRTSQGVVPINLYEPVFNDGTDIPGPGKTIHTSNYWAEFVYDIVRRYMPDGILANQERWPHGAGVRVWEIWNEPDFRTFWAGSVNDYARLLKVAYLAARHADPEARIMVGGLVLFEQPDFAAQLFNIYRDDPEPVDRRYPFHIVGVHSYSHPPYAFYAVQQIHNLIGMHRLGDVEVWLNESGVAVWDDYPGPAWDTRPESTRWRATQHEAAAYLIQNAAFAFLAGADRLFHFQLYDDCGNQPRGTTFAPHDGSYCNTGAVCWGDALGLVRNEQDNVCFNQHPQPGTPRPAYDAYAVVADVLGGSGVVPLTGYVSGGQWRVIFARPSRAEIITVVWDETGRAGEITVQPRSGEATLIGADGSRNPVRPAADGMYHITLAPATNRNQEPGSAFAFMIGGLPVILVEQSSRPVVNVLPLLDDSHAAALVRWQASDPAAIQAYEVYYRDDTSGANEWVLWIQTGAPGEEPFAAGIGRKYSFFARGLGTDGQWTADAPYPQAWTTLR